MGNNGIAYFREQESEYESAYVLVDSSRISQSLCASTAINNGQTRSIAFFVNIPACYTPRKSREYCRKTQCFSYGFAQQIHYPFDCQQTGPEYFKTARKCGIFGMCNDCSLIQVNYLIDEAENPGKGADCVVSLVHHYLDTYGCNEEEILLHADNCVGQNKNNATIHYLLWRTLTKRNKSTELSFMLAGHTKFSPDRYFGYFKKAFGRSTVDTLEGVVAIVDSSTHNHQNVPQVIRDIHGKVQVPFYKWTSFLANFFKIIPNITSYHNFKTSADRRGKVRVSAYSDSNEQEWLDLLIKEGSNTG